LDFDQQVEVWQKTPFFWGGWKSQDQLHEEKLGLWIYGVISSVRGWAEGIFWNRIGAGRGHPGRKNVWHCGLV